MLQPILHSVNAKRVVLASGSPRRKLILENVGLKFEVIPSTFEENLDKSNMSPKDYVVQTAAMKTQEVSQRLLKTDQVPDLIIGADTVVSQGSEIFEKPKDKEDAVRILSQLSASCHNVYTGVVLFVPSKSTLMPNGVPVLDGKFRHLTFVESTSVHMTEMSESVIRAYIETGEPMDKAGGYGIQAWGGTLVEKIDGDYYNVMGFPLHRFAKHLVSLWKDVE